jgi:hypothetical protein
MYRVIPNFIDVEEQIFLKDLVTNYKVRSGNNLRSYAEHEQHDNSKHGRFSEPIYFIPIVDELKNNTRLQDIVKRMQKVAGVSKENPNTYFNWVISIAPRGTEVLHHRDPINSDVPKTKKILRINLIAQNAKRGGEFQIFSPKTNEFVVAKIPDRGLMMFDASELTHRITINTSNTTRINLSIDALIDR